MFRTDGSNRSHNPRAFTLITLMSLFALAGSLPAGAQSIPAVVFSQANGLQGVEGVAGSPTTNYQGTVAHLSANSRGDVFATVQANGGAYVLEIPADGSPQVALILQEGGLYGGPGAYVDQNNNLWVPDTGDAKILYVPFVNNTYPTGAVVPGMANCAAFPVPATQTTACVVPLNYNNFLNGYGQAADLGLDGAGNLYALFKYAGNGSVYQGDDVIIRFATDGTSEVVGGALQNDAFGEIAVNSAGDVFVCTYGSVKEFAHADYSTSIPVYNLNGPDGVSVDASGNLYINNQNAGNILEYPYLNGTYGLPGSTPSIVSNQLSTGYSPNPPSNGVAIDGFGKITMAGNYPNSLSTLTVGRLAFGSTPINTTSGALTLNMVFNSATTFGSFQVTGPFAVSTAALPGGDTACSPGTVQAAAHCSVNLVYNPTAAGFQLGQIAALDSQGNILGTAVLSGNGTSATINVDPGTNSPTGSGFTAPSAVAVDQAGNLYVADSNTGNIYKTTAGSTTAAVAVSGFSAPSAVAVDGQGNLYVADTGNAEIVEVPYISSSSSYGTPSVLLSGVSGPSGLALDQLGDLYVADSGNARVLRLANAGGLGLGTLVTNFGSGFAKPVAVAVDSNSQNVYISDAGNNTVYQVGITTLAQASVITTLKQAGSLAVDPSGSVYVIDGEAATITRIPFIAGSINPNFETTLAAIVTSPSAIATDSLGNLYVADTADDVVTADLRGAGIVTFGNITVGTTSGTIAALVSNSGTASLTLSSPLYTEAGATSSFTIESASTCAAGSSFTSGQSCSIQAAFSPQTYGSLTDTLTLGSSATNTASLAFNGVGSPVLINTTLSLAVTSMGTPTYKQPITITATLVPASQAAATPTGHVTFLVDGNAQQPASTLNSATGTASITLTNLGGGTHTITATYTGDYFYSSTSSGPLNLRVAQLNTATTVSVTVPYSNPTAANPTQAVTLTATVVPPVAGFPTGTVSFYSGTTLLGSAATSSFSPTKTTTEGVAAFTTTTLAPGQYEVTATYSGDANYTGSSASTPVALLIANPTVNLVPSATTVVGGGAPVTLTIGSIAGFNNAVNFSCSGLPMYAACSFSPAYAEVGPGNAAPISFSIVIDQPPVIAVPAAIGAQAGIAGRPKIAAALSLVLLLPALLFGFARRSNGRSLAGFSATRLSTLAAFLLLTGLGITLSGCGSTNASYITPAGTSTVTVNATITVPNQVNPSPAATLQLQLTVP